MSSARAGARQHAPRGRNPALVLPVDDVRPAGVSHAAACGRPESAGVDRTLHLHETRSSVRRLPTRSVSHDIPGPIGGSGRGRRLETSTAGPVKVSTAGPVEAGPRRRPQASDHRAVTARSMPGCLVVIGGEVPPATMVAMDDLGMGRLLRAVRIRRGLRQEDVAAAARVSRSVVSLAERGRFVRLHVGDVRAIAEVLEVRLPFAPSWRGGEADRVVNERHSLMHERLASIFADLPGWVFRTEVTFSVYGERGSIDLLGWHPDRRALLISELKSELVDPAALVAQVDRYERLAAEIARDHGWDPLSVSVWVVVADSSMNRRRLARHRTMLRNRYPLEGRTMRSWLRQPHGSVAALSFMADAATGRTPRKAAPAKRVRRRVGASEGSSKASSKSRA